MTATGRGLRALALLALASTVLGAPYACTIAAAPGRTFAISVSTLSDAGASPASAQSVATFARPTTPACTALSATDLRVAWSLEGAPASAVSYRLFRNGVSIATLPAGTTEYVDQGLNTRAYAMGTGITYAYKVSPAYGGALIGPAESSEGYGTPGLLQHAGGLWIYGSGLAASRDGAWLAFDRKYAMPGTTATWGAESCYRTYEATGTMECVRSFSYLGSLSRSFAMDSFAFSRDVPTSFLAAFSNSNANVYVYRCAGVVTTGPWWPLFQTLAVASPSCPLCDIALLGTGLLLYVQTSSALRIYARSDPSAQFASSPAASVAWPSCPNACDLMAASDRRVLSVADNRRAVASQRGKACFVVVEADYSTACVGLGVAGRTVGGLAISADGSTVAVVNRNAADTIDLWIGIYRPSGATWSLAAQHVSADYPSIGAIAMNPAGTSLRVASRTTYSSGSFYAAAMLRYSLEGTTVARKSVVLDPFTFNMYRVPADTSAAWIATWNDAYRCAIRVVQPTTVNYDCAGQIFTT